MNGLLWEIIYYSRYCNNPMYIVAVNGSVTEINFPFYLYIEMCINFHFCHGTSIKYLNPTP